MPNEQQAPPRFEGGQGGSKDSPNLPKISLKTYLQLVRPANVVTAIADILAGVAIASFIYKLTPIDPYKVFLLCIATIGLYSGGIVFNDIFDADLDKIERPERAIPSGKITLQQATIFGGLLLSIGIIAAWASSATSGIIALLIAICALVYDKFGKHHAIIGPINMGLCRGLNLVLGMSIIEGATAQWIIGILPICYIAAITLISRDEVHGGKRFPLYLAASLYLFVSMTQLFIAHYADTLFYVLPFVALHVYLIFKPLLTAIQNPIGANIGKAVKAGVLSLIVMDAAWVSVSGQWLAAIFVLSLLPVSIKLAKIFAVT